MHKTNDKIQVNDALCFPNISLDNSCYLLGTQTTYKFHNALWVIFT